MCGHTGSYNRGCEALVQSKVININECGVKKSMHLASFDELNPNETIKTKYLHIMPMDSKLITGGTINMINENPDDFDINEHLFIVTSKTNYDLFGHYNNVVYEPEILNKRYDKFIEYGICSEYIFMHSLPLSLRQMLLLDTKIANKIIWCVWGHDLYRKPPILKGNISIYRKLRRLAYLFLFDIAFVNKVKKFSAIGISFKYDVLEVRRIYGDGISVLMAPYGFGYPKSDVDNVIAEYKKNKKVKNKTLKIMIGHSSFPFLKHEEILSKLLKYKEENITITIPLSYGEEEYGKHIEIIAKQLFEEKVEIIKDYMSPTDYVKFLMSVDVAIFDYEHQSALGNIMLLLYLGKKVYLSNKGIIHWAMRAEGIKTYDANDIGNVPFEVLSSEHAFDERAVIYSGYYLNENNIMEQWKTTFKGLRQNRIF